ncbi:outer membrane receptor protein involved in Fe transport [Chitinophaga niastensis]|uniref:Outer membrane receptor protein involved in Fe transport n=1 Tax=Chitinophaga niastensis TaxID=536980 RepID=A0A2P8HHC6_CHINA|nr:outer membrane beta-barrel family protein [Chitinophaga niastensis]PSL45600.1 outer membrane receptor protein involved in Fe transport [Chitinophaga niastensis]
MQKIYLLLIACCLAFAAHAQKNGSIKGTLLDTIGRQPVASATITLLKKKDSSLVTFTMTDNKGYFELTGIAAGGEYRLLITHVNYHNASRLVTISPTTPNTNLNNIILHDLTKTLDEVVVTAEAPPVTLIGDTIQYNAGSFKTQPNANVEQLLKKMPGIQVDKNGTVKAQGQKINRILVDGKEFFGSDPKIATKNLPADAVDKVQVYDKLSDAAQLTGFDDGNSEKTINLKLKQDKKKGLFGKATAGAGTNNRYEGRFNVNSFKGARQLSAIGMVNNTNAEGFSFMDLMNFTGELNRMQQNGSGNISFTLNADDPVAALMGSGNSNGIKTIWGGGINYNNIIGNKTNFTSNYFYNRYNPYQESVVQRQYFLPDSSYFYNQHSTSDNLYNSHRLNLSADIRIDSFNSVKISSSIGHQETRNNGYSSYETLSENQQPANQGFSNNYSLGHGTNFSNDVLFRKKFHRKGRTFSLGLQTSSNNSESNGSLLSVNHYYNRHPSQPDYDSINQRNTISGNLNSHAVRAVYTEPLFRRSLLEFSLGSSNTKTTSDKITYDYNQQNDKFDQLNPRLTNNFENTYGYTNAGLRLRTKRKKFSLAAGFNWQQAAFKGKIIAGTKDSVIHKTFYNLLPSLRFKYDFTRYRNLNINYAAITNQPNMSQLQPVPDITDPLNIREGNPDLKQELTHAVQLNFISVNPFRNKNLFAFFDLQETQNKIVDDDVVDTLGVKHTRPVNINGAYNMTGNISLGLPLRLLKGTVNFSTNVGYSKTKQFINAVPNTIRTFTLGPTARFDINPSSKVDLSLSAGFNYYKTAYSLQAALNTGYFSQQYEGAINWQLPANFYFSTSFTYTINSQRANGFNTKVPLCNASFSRQFLHFNRGELKLSVYDLLNENVGISRSTNQNYIEDSRVKNLQRFFLLSFTYSLSKNGLSQGSPDGGLKIIRH